MNTGKEPFKLCDEKLYKLYELTFENEKHYLSEHQRRVSFYIGLISALITVTIAGLIQSEEWYECFVLLLGPITILVISWIAIKGANRFYQLFLESITKLKKIELDFGLHKNRNQNSSEENDWTANECYVPKRHKESTEYPKYESSDEWVKGHMFFSEYKTENKIKRKFNYNGVVVSLFIATSVLAVLLLHSIIIIGTIRFFE